MYDSIQEEMLRYPVFSYNESHEFDGSDLFKDEQMQRHNCKNLYKNNVSKSQKKKTQTIISIYDKINSNNANDPLYGKNFRVSQQYKNKHYSTITSARHANIGVDKNIKEKEETKGQKNISKFVGEIAQSLTNQDQNRSQLYRLQKISLLKRIIEHYNLKSVEKKYYSNLIKSFGLKIASINSEEIVSKKSIHPRQMETLKQITQSTQQLRLKEIQEHFSSIKQEKQKKTVYRRFKPCLSFMNNKNLIHSSQEIGQSDKSLKTETKKEPIKKPHIEKMKKTMDSTQKIIQKPLRLQSSSTNIEAKIMKYREFLFVLNYSNHLYQELDFDKYQTTFKYFVGRGNNANLIKSLMKKRFWFEETKKPQEAHFIWTQIKLNQIFDKEKQASLNFLKNETGKTIQQSKSERRRQHSVIEVQKNNKNTIKPIKFSKNQISAKHFEPLDPLLKVLTIKEMKEIKQLEDGLGMKKNYQFSKKVRTCKRRLKIQESQCLIHNHFPLNGLLGNKKAMYYNLREYCRLTDKKISEYVPLTFHIKKGFLDEQYKNFSSVFVERKKLKLPNYWIIKPGQFSNRGQGISCTTKFQQIRKRIIQSKNASKKGQESSLIIQLYLSNPLLYNSRKFDIRAFMMLTCINGKMKAYWYQEGYIRTSSFIWSLSEIEDKYIHLTNDAIQKNCYEYGMFEPGNKLSYGQLQRYLCSVPGYSKSYDFFGTIYPRMREIATDTIKSIFLNIDPKRLRDNFQIFGLDFMLDNTFKPWLIQVNTNPCLEINCPLLERILPHMLENALRISVDPLFPPPFNVQTDYKYAIPENAVHYNKFELIFDEDRDRSLLHNLYADNKIRTSQHNIVEELDDIQEDQEEFEEEGYFIDYQD